MRLLLLERPSPYDSYHLRSVFQPAPGDVGCGSECVPSVFRVG